MKRSDNITKLTNILSDFFPHKLLSPTEISQWKKKLEKIKWNGEKREKREKNEKTWKKMKKKEKKCEKMKKMWKKSQLGCLNMDAKKSRAKNYFVTCVAQHDEIFFACISK